MEAFAGLRFRVRVPEASLSRAQGVRAHRPLVRCSQRRLGSETKTAVTPAREARARVRPARVRTSECAVVPDRC